ncbi:MAG: hypothetical protein AABY10_03035, partial [Nanoarchaeota archaeon]
MAFKKALFVNIKESDLDKEYWNKLDLIIEKRVFLSKDDPKVIHELKDTDCLLVGFGVPVTREHIDAAPNLKYIGTLAVAYHKVDTKYAR